MAIVDLATSSFILFTVNVREKIEVVEDVCASPAEYFKELTSVFKKSRKSRRLINLVIYLKEDPKVFRNVLLYSRSCTS